MKMPTMDASRPFQALLDEHSSGVLAFLRAMVGPNDAEDCFQETFIAALRNYEGRDPDGNARAWLLLIARNKAIDHFRASKRRPTPREWLPEPTAPPMPAGDPELWQLVGELPEKQRAAVALRYAADLRFREIGEAMGTSDEAARRSVHEGLKKLRSRIEGEDR